MKSLDSRTQGILWEINATLCFTSLTALVKLVSTELPTPIIAFYRICLAMSFVLPVAFTQGISKPKKDMLIWYFFHTLTVTATLNAAFYVSKHLPLSMAMVIGYTEPMIQTIFSVLFLGASVTLLHWILILLGYAGVFFIAYTKYSMKGAKEELLLTALLMALLSSLLISTVKVITKRLTSKEPPHQVVFYSSLMNIVTSFFFAFFTSSASMTLPPAKLWMPLFIVGFLGFMIQYSSTKALSLADMHVLSPISYFRLIFSLPIGYYFFDEAPTWSTLLGSAIIILTNYLLLRPRGTS